MSSNTLLINAAFEQVKKLELIYGDSIPSSAIEEGFTFHGEKVLLLNRVRGIFKPRQMAEGVLSIKTTIPRDGGVNIYNDQLTDDGYYQYSLQAGDPRGSGNKCLWQAYESKQPFVYFHAVAPAVYKALWPCFVDNIYPEEGHARILVGVVQASTITSKVEYTVPDEIESRYMVRESKVRLHQAAFRSAILDVYQNRCAVTGMVEAKLIDAAHIIPDAEVGSSQLINNGIALSNIHHRAYDRGLIGIDPDYKIHVSDDIELKDDNGFIKNAFTAYDQKVLFLPSNKKTRPDRDSLAQRYERFKKLNGVSVLR